MQFSTNSEPEWGLGEWCGPPWPAIVSYNQVWSAIVSNSQVWSAIVSHSQIKSAKVDYSQLKLAKASHSQSRQAPVSVIRNKDRQRTRWSALNEVCFQEDHWVWSDHREIPLQRRGLEWVLPCLSELHGAQHAEHSCLSNATRLLSGPPSTLIHLSSSSWKDVLPGRPSLRLSISFHPSPSHLYSGFAGMMTTAF